MSDADPALLDQLRMLERAGEPGLVEQLIRKFLDGSGELLRELFAASDAHDLERLRLISHTLKSNAASFGAFALAEVCEEIEAAARAGRASLDAAVRRRLIDLHRASCAALRRELG